jgi:hypothetical protein
MHSLIAPAALLSLLHAVQPTPQDVVARYVAAIGGEKALRSIASRITEGEFDNGRGLTTRYRMIEQSPNRRVTLIGPDPIDSPTGSGRGFDGTNGWDKNYIGTGLRRVTGDELADTAREADMLRPLRLLEDCLAATIDSQGDTDVVHCMNRAGNRIGFHFERKTGLLIRQDVGGARAVTLHFEEYRGLDGVMVPFRIRIDITGATVQFNARTIVHNVPVESGVFARPRS